MAAKIQGAISGKRQLLSVKEKTAKSCSNSKEERVARNNLKQAVVISIITTFATAATGLATILINKTPENSIDPMVTYREAAVQVMSDQLKERDKETNNVKQEIQLRMEKEKNPKKLKEWEYIRDRVDEIINNNRQSFPGIFSGGIESVMDLKQKKFVLAEMKREVTLVKLFREAESRLQLIKLLTPYNLRNTIAPDYFPIANQVGGSSQASAASSKFFDRAEKPGLNFPNKNLLNTRSPEKSSRETEAVIPGSSGGHFTNVLKDALLIDKAILTGDNLEGKTLDKFIRKPATNEDDINRLKERNSGNAIRFTVGRTF
jgi:hypothetical protein